MKTPLAVRLSAVLALLPLLGRAQQTPRPPTPDEAANTTLTRVAFGSCLDEKGSQRILRSVAFHRPELFLFLGDNIYGDSPDPEVLRAKYRQQIEGDGMQALLARTRVLATWDDHDYGVDDGGAEFAGRRVSQQEFCDAWGYGENAARRGRDGIWDSVVFGPPERRVQVILLDTRSHRSPLQRRGEPLPAGVGATGPYVADPDPDATLLGAEQWAWLEAQLRVPARVRLICTSIQFLADEHGWECWGNFPHERQRMLEMIARTQARGVVFLSGDRHAAEMSCLPASTDGRGPGYPLWDVTSSSLNKNRPWVNEPNRLRRTSVFWEHNYGMVRIDWTAEDPVVSLEIWGGDDTMWFAEPVPLSSLAPVAEPELESADVLERIAFVSCIKQAQPQPLWTPLLARKPQLLLMLGDNIYGDTEDMDEMQRAYDTLAANPLFAAVREQVPILATWDDHDLGSNDAGVNYPRIEASKGRFLDFFGVAEDDIRRQRPGVYRAFYYGPRDRRVQVLMLDTRSFRTPLAARTVRFHDGHAHPGHYLPLRDPQATMLGAAQWAWLEQELRVPAAVRVLCSSIQVLSEGHGWECWANMPLERERLFRAIREARATGVVIVSGDMHIGERMALAPHDSGVPYTLHEFTSSGLNQGWDFTNYHNLHRVGTPMFDPNHGWIELDWAAADPRLTIGVEREDGRLIRGDLSLSELR